MGGQRTVQEVTKWELQHFLRRIDLIMEYQTYDANCCIMTRLLTLMSGRWKAIILHLIRSDINRFSMMEKAMPRISKKVLTEQLRELESDKLITRTVKGTKAPFEVTYSLTEGGASLRKLLDDMLSWGMEYYKDEIDEAWLTDHHSKLPVNLFLQRKRTQREHSRRVQ